MAQQWLLVCCILIGLCWGQNVNTSNELRIPNKEEMLNRLANMDVFDGFGGLSGGGATSKLLASYAEPYRSQILDYLFKPNFGASVHILKVEIGGDAQSTEGTESSHMHNPWEENYHRGYEWWLMKEAKKRNPYIILFGLPWGFPGWVGKGVQSPYKYPNLTATYIAKWVLNAKSVHNLDINYLGIWNERDYNVEYVKVLRATLDQFGLQNTKVAVADSGWEVLQDLPQMRPYIHAIGVHYPGTLSTEAARNSGMRLWSAEDYSTFNDDVGSGCLAKIMNQNYVNGKYTSTIMWNLIAAYSDDLPFPRCALMTANSPWSGNYDVAGPIWVMAHSTQFTQPGWLYVPSATQKLQFGGSIVTLTDPNMKEFTIILESMTHDHSVCIRPAFPDYDVKNQTVNIEINIPIDFFHMWVTTLRFGKNEKSTYFEYKGPVKIPSSRILSIPLETDMLITLSTITTARKGQYPPPPRHTPQPIPYSDDFEGYNEFEEPQFLVPQVGSMEVVKLARRAPGASMVNADEEDDLLFRGPEMATNQVLKQTALMRAVDWCTMDTNNTIAVMGNYSWSGLNAQIDIQVPQVNGSQGIFLAARVDRGGCDVAIQGVFFWLRLDLGQFLVTADFAGKTIYQRGTIDVKQDTWYTLAFNLTKESVANFTVNGQLVVKNLQLAHSVSHGFFAIGTAGFGVAYFDNLKLLAAEV